MNAYERKLEVFEKIDKTRTASNIPIEISLSEANVLYTEAVIDREKLTAAGLDWSLVEDLPDRISALQIAQTKLINRRNELKQRSQIARQATVDAARLRSDIVHHMRFLVRDDRWLVKEVSSHNRGNARGKIMEDLKVLHLKAEGLPVAINDELQQSLNRVVDTVDHLCKADTDSVDTRDCVDALVIRDQAYTHFYEAVSEIQVFGRYLFRANTARHAVYCSAWLRAKRARRRRKKAEVVLPLPEPVRDNTSAEPTSDDKEQTDAGENSFGPGFVCSNHSCPALKAWKDRPSSS